MQFGDPSEMVGKLEPHQRVIGLIGLPRAGKSTWARMRARMGDGSAVVSPDAIRRAIYGWDYYDRGEPLVHAHAQLMADALFFAGHSVVIIDATHTTAKRRQVWEDRYGAEAITWLVFRTPAEVCIKRAEDGGRHDLVEVIRRMAGAWDVPADGPNVRTYED